MHTLVLNQSMQPIDQVSWDRAITLLFTDKVEVLEEYDDWVVRSVTVSIKVPAVIRLLNAVATKKRGVRFSREAVYTRDKGRCQYCSRALKRPEATYDHVLPRRLGGKTNWTNIVIACQPCNTKKGGRTPEQAKMRLQVQPIKPKHLPETLHLTLPRGKMPHQWQDYLRDAMYWHAALDED